MPVKGIISEYRSEVGFVFEWRISDFFTLSEEDGAYYYSPEFSFGGETWFLGIFPNGSSGRRSSGHLDLLLIKCDSGRSIRQSISLSLKTAKGEKYHEEHYTRDFEELLNWHAFHRFIQRSELTRRMSELVPEGVLTVVCTMKSSPSAESESSPKWYWPFFKWNSKETVTVTEAAIAGTAASAERCSAHSDLAPTPSGPESERTSASSECCHCKRTFDAESLHSHKKKCMHRPIKCPDCLKVVLLQKWLDEHECQKMRPKGNSGSAECSSDANSDECCHKCLECLDIIKKQKLLEELETQKESSEGAKSLCEDYKKVLLGGRHHDLILKVGDKEFRAHRDILRARSKVFESMLDHDMKEKNTAIIDVSDCDPNAMELFLSYVYCGKIEALDHNNMLGLYYIADKYEMIELKRECCNFIKKSLSLTSVCYVIQLALNHSDSDLLEYATGYFEEHVLDVLQTVEWQSFLKDNSTVGNELLIKSIKKLKNA